MKIIFDAMSGDNAPEAIVNGAVQARRSLGVEIVLVGREPAIRECLETLGAAEDGGIGVVPASDIIDMHDDPSTAVRRKKDASMSVALELLRAGGGDAVISAGNTGALLTGATLLIKRIRGIRRAAMAPLIPNGGKGALLIDCGANVECTPEYLLQFGFMGSFYARTILGIPKPRVGLLNNGAEETKGTALCRAAYALLTEAARAGRIDFIGNVEGPDVFSGKVDVVVTDGFTGNIFLKTVEGAGKFMMKNIKNVLTASPKAKAGALMLKDGLSGLKRLLDPAEVGGTPFLGIQKPVLKAHGGSDARAIAAAAKRAVEFVESGFIREIEENIEYMKIQ